jgi:hypothetical protein
MFYLNTKYLLRIKWKITREKLYYYSVISYCRIYDSHAFSFFIFLFRFPHQYGMQLPVVANVLALFRIITEVSKAL